MKRILLIFSLLICFACSPIRVTYDYEKNAKFENYKTYNYYSDMKSGMSELDTKRLINALDTALQSKGFTRSDYPDFFVDIGSSEFRQQSNSNMVVGAGTGGRNVGGGISVGIPVGQPKLSREIVIEFVDEKGIGLFWQAVSESNYNPNASPEKRETQFTAIAAKIIEGYPPSQE